MSIQFPDVFSAFTSYYFEWNYVRVPDEQIGRPAAFEELNPEEPSRLDVARRRFSRAGRYAIEDVETMVSELGPAGVSALTLVAANAILRFIGTGIRLGIELLTMPSGERSIAFPGPGVYVVRNKAIPYTGEKAELVRPPSVAYQPVIVRDPVELVEERARQDAAVAERDFARMEELRELLSEPLSHLGEEQMREELSILERSLSSLGSSLDVQREQLVRYRDSLPEGSKEREQAERQLDRLYEIFMVRAGRAEHHDLSGAQPLIASFIGDTGQSIRLSMEAVYEDERDGEMIYWVSDLTTPDSSQGTCTGSSRSEAIMNAVESILRGQGGYGRGHVAVNIDGITYTRRITASLGSLFEEALVNITLALSVAVVVAAPFTNFATLVLLLPIGAVGAIPSVYRIINRAIDDTLRFDMATVMDIVNIVGGLAGLGHAVTPLRMVNVGRAFMIAGLGADGLGMLLIPVGVVAQIMDLPEGMTSGERSAQIMEILGQAMLNVGIMAGGALAQRARQQRMEAHGQVTTPEPAPRPGVPETETPGGRVSTRWEELLTPEMRRILEADPELRRLYAEMNPEVRRLLTLCASVCIPTDPKPSAQDIQRIQALLNRLNLPGDHAGLREYLHVRRRELTRAVDDIADVADLTELQARLDRAIAERATTAGAAASRGANGLWEYRRSDGLVVWEHELASYGHQASSRQTRGFFQSHHGIQDAWARERVPGYERGKGEAILLRDSRSGTPHQIVTSRQSGRAAGIEGRTYSQERQLMLEDMAGADVPSSTAQRLLANADAYFAELYRVLARSGMNEEALRSIFGNWRP